MLEFESFTLFCGDLFESDILTRSGEDMRHMTLGGLSRDINDKLGGKAWTTVLGSDARSDEVRDPSFINCKSTKNARRFSLAPTDFLIFFLGVLDRFLRKVGPMLHIC